MSCEYLRSVPIRRLHHPIEENPIWNILGSAISGVIAVALSLPFLLAFLVVLPACLSVRWLLLFIHCSRQGSRNGPGPESVRGNDSRWLGTEWRSSVIHAVLVFEAKEGVNVDHFRRLLLKRVIPVYPRLTKRLISLPMSAGVGNCWLTDKEFSIDNHVFSGPSFLTKEKDLQDYVSKLVEDGLPEDKPPWQLQVFQSFGVDQDIIVILRVHQSVADGTALMRLLCHSLADSQVIDIPERPRFGSFEFWFNVFRACIVGPLTVLVWLFLSAEDCNLLTHRSAWTGSVTVTWSASITLPKVIRIKQVTRSTVNCVLLSALAGALRRLLQGCGVSQPPNVKVVVPMDLRNQSSSVPMRTRLGNKTSSMTMPLPVAVEGCVPRLWATRKTLDSVRTSADPVILYVATAALMSVGSASFARHLVNFLTDKASLQFASLAGPSSEISLEGQTLKGIYPILPAQANLGISITTITYADQVFVSVIAERALGPMAELILEYLEDQIEILWKLLLHRRVPDDPNRPTSFSKPLVSESPVKEIATRLNLVQKEVESLSEAKENDKEGKLCTLRAEFSELVDELKRRQSLSETEDTDSPWNPRRRAFSCSTAKKLINIPLNPLRPEFLDSDESKESSQTSLEEQTSQTKHQNVNLDLDPKNSLSFATDSKNVLKNNQQLKNPKDYVINISESCLNPTDLTKGGDRSLSDKENIKIHEGSLGLNKNQKESGSDHQKRTIYKSKSNRNKSKLRRDKQNLQIVKIEEINISSNIEEKIHRSDTESEENPLEMRSEVSDTIIKIPDVDVEDMSGFLGPNDCDLNNRCYKKQLMQASCECHEARIQGNHDDSDESEIVGGVLI